jgi:molybdopterin converting factor subunit 1
VKIVVQLFAAARELAGTSTLEIDLAADANVSRLRKALIAACPALTALAPHLLFAVNASYATDATPIVSGDEIACFPPTSGG